MNVRVVISGRHYEAAESIPPSLTLPDGSSVSHALNALAELIADGSALPDTCLVAVSGTHLGTLRDYRDRALEDDDELIVIAPVAGG